MSFDPAISEWGNPPSISRKSEWFGDLSLARTVLRGLRQQGRELRPAAVAARLAQTDCPMAGRRERLETLLVSRDHMKVSAPE